MDHCNSCIFHGFVDLNYVDYTVQTKKVHCKKSTESVVSRTLNLQHTTYYNIIAMTGV